MHNLIVKPPKPRNPFVAACLKRAAGAHVRNRSAQRHRTLRALRLELHESQRPRRDP